MAKRRVEEGASGISEDLGQGTLRETGERLHRISESRCPFGSVPLCDFTEERSQVLERGEWVRTGGS